MTGVCFPECDGRLTPASLRVTTHVLFCADRRFFQHMAVAAVSLAAVARSPLQIHVMSCDADAAAEAKLREALRPFDRVDVAVHHVDPARLADLFVDRHLSKEAYLRFLAPEVLPGDVDRVVYLDSDVVVLDDVSALFAVDLQGKAVGAAPDLDWSGHAPTDRLRALGVDPAAPYVNSGVLVMDLARWRRDGLSRRLLDFAAQKGALLLRHDQDALNAVLRDDIRLIDRRWNLQVLLLSHWARRGLPLDHAATAEARRRPAILHFSTADKPWKFRVWTRRKALYHRFLDRTPWRGEPPPGLTRAQALEHRIAVGLLRLGVDVYAAGGATRRLRRMLGAAAARLPPLRRTEPGRSAGV
jgi:lipopolysaccharide biosynthesis glycosyltransferase